MQDFVGWETSAFNHVLMHFKKKSDIFLLLDSDFVTYGSYFGDWKFGRRFASFWNLLRMPKICSICVLCPKSDSIVVHVLRNTEGGRSFRRSEVNASITCSGSPSKI